MQSVETLDTTTFGGRRFTRKQLAQVQQTVETFKNLSRWELAETICEHLDWKTPQGKNKTSSGLTLLEEIEARGLIALPAKRHCRKPRQRPIAVRQAEAPVTYGIEELGPITLQLAKTKKERALWASYVQSHHYLGYRKPVGAHLLYFVVSEKLNQRLGCLSFAAATLRKLAPRDEWIGWEDKHRKKLLNLVLTQTRFLVFPWVNVHNLASKVLSLSAKQVGDDWVKHHGYRPLLIETFVDTSKFSGASYQAANWQYLGETKGKGRSPDKPSSKSPKSIFAYPLCSDFRRQLTQGHRTIEVKKRYRNDLKQSRKRSVGEPFMTMWENVVDILHGVAEEYDQKWRVRRRVLGSLLLMLLIFRLVISKNSQSYGTTIDELWDSCEKLQLPIPQEHSVKPAAFCKARKKLEEGIFKRINNEIFLAYGPKASEQTWHGHRLFAVDGSKVNLPRELQNDGYTIPSKNAHYPQGLLSAIYQLKTQLPYDFDLVAHADERVCAKQHLDTLKHNDVVIYDRGYYSYVMLHQHHTAGVHAIFRLQQNSGKAIQEFIDGPLTDTIVTIFPSQKSQSEIRKAHPQLQIVPLKMRLLKYQIGSSTFFLGTTLVEENQCYPVLDFTDVYHARWGIEELYKISKNIIDVEDFHAKSERGVKQELFAHFTLITMNRLFANQADDELNEDKVFDSFSLSSSPRNDSSTSTSLRTKLKTNFKNCLQVFFRHLEPLLMVRNRIATTVIKIFTLVASQYQRTRPGRSYPRKSMRPDPRWRPSKSKKKKIIPATVAATPT